MNRRLLLLAIGAIAAAVALIWMQLSMATVVTIGSVEFQVRVADTQAKQIRGLRGVHSLATRHGMLFVFHDASSRTFTMQGMSIPLDFLWINNGQVVGLNLNAQPERADSLNRYPSPVPVQYVLELPAGSVAQAEIHVGDPVVIGHR